MFSPFATSDKTSMPSTAPRAKTPNLGVLVKALAVKYHYYFFLISSMKPTLTYLYFILVLLITTYIGKFQKFVYAKFLKNIL